MMFNRNKYSGGIINVFTFRTNGWTLGKGILNTGPDHNSRQF